MELPADYRTLLEEDKRPLSRLVALLRAGERPPSPQEVVDRLAEEGLRVVAGAPRSLEEGGWGMQARVGLADREETVDRTVLVGVRPAPGLSSFHLEEVRLGRSELGQSELEEAERGEWALELDMRFGGVALEDFHLQVRAVVAAAREPVVVVDVSACAVHSGRWMRDVAAGSVPPAPRYLYSLHSVVDKASPEAPLWLHTHGLLRCGSVELELVGVRQEYAGVLERVLRELAPLFIERLPPPPDEPFTVDEALSLVWLPWEEGVKRMGRSVPGGAARRDAVHEKPSGLLFVPERRLLGLRRKYASVSRYVRRRVEEPVERVSARETERMGLLARERLPAFEELLLEHGGQQGWRFLVKLGYLMDGVEVEEEEREHLWFEVQSMKGDFVEATLLNSPRGVLRFSQGDSGRHPLTLVSDWRVVAPQGRFGPDTVLALVRGLKNLSGKRTG